MPPPGRALQRWLALPTSAPQEQAGADLRRGQEARSPQGSLTAPLLGEWLKALSQARRCRAAETGGETAVQPWVAANAQAGPSCPTWDQQGPCPQSRSAPLSPAPPSQSRPALSVTPRPSQPRETRSPEFGDCGRNAGTIKHPSLKPANFGLVTQDPILSGPLGPALRNRPWDPKPVQKNSEKSQRGISFFLNLTERRGFILSATPLSSKFTSKIV